ncbi:MAG: T9SS type A sorting domain-containing protein, partial [Candidatus Kapaibacterium sp.]
VFDTSWKYFNVTDLRQNKEWIVTKDSVLHIDFEPGEGTLLRVAPALGMIAGRVSDLGMAYNNSQRVAEFDSVRKIMVYERKGRLVVSLVNNPTKDGLTNYVDPNGGNVIDTSGRVMNPAVAAKGDTVMIIYNLASKSAGVARPVLIARNVYPCSGAWRFDTVARIPVGTGGASGHLVTPSITPAEDGFFCAYSHPNFGIVRLIRDSAKYITNEHYIRLGDTTNSTVFLSVASQEQKDVDATTEWLHVAFEVDKPADGSSHIYYTRFSHIFNASGNDLDTTFKAEEVSRSCNNLYPNIALKSGYEYNMKVSSHSSWIDTVRKGQPVIVWQNTSTTGYCDSLHHYISAPIVTVEQRERFEPITSIPAWSDLTTFYPKQNGFPLPLVKLGHSMKVHPSDTKDSTATADVRVITFQDTATKEVHLERIIGDRSPNWIHSKLIDQGEYSNLTHPYSPRKFVKARTFTYRGVLIDTASLYAAKIVSRDTGAEIGIKNQIIHTFNVKDTLDCERGLSYSVGGGSSGCPTCQEPGVDPSDSTSRVGVEWRSRDLGTMGFGVTGDLPTVGGLSVHYDSTNYGWVKVEDSIRTNDFPFKSGDQINIDRSFRVFDTSAMRVFVSDTNRFIEFKIVLKDSATNQVLMTGDSIRFLHSTAAAMIDPCFAQQGFPMVLNSIVAGSGHLTLIIKKDSASPLALIHTQLYAEHFAPEIEPADDTSGSAKALPSSPMPSSSVQEPKMQMSIYPNPARTSARIELAASAGLTTHVDVYNVLGGKVSSLYDATAPQDGRLDLTLNATTLPVGTYLVRAICGNEIV